MDLEQTEVQASFAGEKSAGTNPDLEIRNNSTFWPILWIGIYTTLLNIITLTLFRFWGRSQFRRRLWSDTTVGGEPLEYTGTGMELFLGFLLALVTVMLPILVALIGAQVLFGEIGFLIAYILIYIGMIYLIGVALFLARRYHLSRTRLRGVRFAQTGSALEYGARFLGYLLLTGLTLGWLGPHMRLALSCYMWSNAYYGSEKFSFEETAEAAKEPVYASFALAWVAGVIGYIIWFGAIMGIAGSGQMGDIESDPEAMMSFLGMVYGGLFILIFVLIFATSWHEAVMTRKIVKSLHVAGANFSSRISTVDIIWLAVSNAFILVFTLGFGYMVTQMRVWRKIANTMEAAGSVDFAGIKQTSEQGPTQGEGLADGLDLISNF